MKSLISTLTLAILAATGNATTVTVNASSTGTTTTTTKTPGTIGVSNPANRGYAVFNLSAAGIPDAATINSVQLVFTFSISGLGVSPGNIYGYTGDISSLSAAALYAAATTSNTLYTTGWGTTPGTVTMSSTGAADTSVQNNRGTVSLTWVETASTRVYNITGGSNPQLQITYTCNAPAPIVGSTLVCASSTTTLLDTTTGGTWSSANTALATVNASGVVTGVSQGVVNISYTKGGCSATQLMTVKQVPSAISGASTVCVGTPASVSNSAILGTWSSSNPSVATVNLTSGSIYGITGGPATISYTTGCGTAVTTSVTVITSMPSITGATSVCTGATTTLSNSIAGGSWTSAGAAIASVNGSGVVNGRLQGNTTISYSLGSCVAMKAMMVKAVPGAISGASGVCNGGSTILTNTSYGGTWGSASTSVATITTGGLVTGLSAGASVITYTNGCGSDAVSTITVDLIPSALTGPSSACTGSSLPVTETVSGGTWSSSNWALATVSTAGYVYGNAAGTVVISYSLSNYCGSNTVILPITFTYTQLGQWTGAASTSWTDAGNWACGTLPDANTDIIIPAGTPNLPDFSSARFDVGSLEIRTGVTITINSGASICVHRTLINNGTVAGAGVLKMNGTSVQSIQGVGRINNLTICNTSGVTIYSSDTVNISGDVNLNLGTLTTNGGLRLLSTATYAGRIAPVTSGNISGNVTVEQYFNGGRRAFRFLGHPFSHAISLSGISAKLDITGPGGSANGFTGTATNAPSAFRYDPAVGNSSAGYDPGWRSFTNANAFSDTNAFNRHQGIRIYVRGAKGEGLGYGSYTPSACTIEMTGLVNTGTQVVALHKGLNSDYNQVSNPYPSPTDIGVAIADAQAAGQITGAAFYVWNPFLGAAGAYEPKFIGGSYVISQNSSFQVRATSDSAELTFTESNKASNSDESLLRAAPSQYSSLGIYDESGRAWDKLYVSFNENATVSEDAKYDALKATNPDLNFYSIAGSKKFAVDARPYADNQTIQLGLTTGYAQKYVIRAENIVVPTGASLYLRDKMSGTNTLLQNGAEYSFEVSNDKSAQGENRFELVTSGSVAVEAQSGLSVSLSPNPATDNVTISYTTDGKNETRVNVTNVTGATVITKSAGNIASGKMNISLNELQAGIYMVEIVSGNDRKVEKLVKE